MEALSFKGKGLEYFKIWIVNVLLVIVTLGIYYPWAKVRNKRYFYANTELEGRNFEYHATGRQLLVGYLIAMGLLITYVVISEVWPIGSLALLGIFFLGLPWVIWRSLMFDLGMTSFSNVRFSFKGGLKEAYVNFLLIPIAWFLTLYGIPVLLIIFVTSMGDASRDLGIIFAVIGFAFVLFSFYVYAYMQKRNTCYSVNNTRFGQAAFAVDIDTKPFFKIIIKSIALGILASIVLMVVLGIFVTAMIGAEGASGILQGMQNPETAQDIFKSGILFIIGPVYLGMIIVGFLVFGYSYARRRTYIYDHCLLDDKVAFNSTLKARAMAWVTISNFLMIVFTLGLAMPWAKVRMMKLLANNTFVDTQHGFDEYITQQMDTQSSLGDQISDAFGVDVGVAI